MSQNYQAARPAVEPTSSRWTHRHTGRRGADPIEDQWRDLYVLCDGEVVSRVHQLDPRHNEWTWAGSWAGEGNRGTAPTMMAALRTLPEAWERRG